ncbi:NAD(P)/FAD-dependent oxidoreductase [Mesonia ostreae]|uniref:NAD(P)/FAD-dependent oxidoreductase n=1 Tax=Mesonia ostreae TaxID=861110 RepID=A0ABU2KHT9_9FLAO|nr:NAD(P)/FAD-dependent oxidoreductase [Mesonia ostreae]MDT0294254.1 NAD(P)/FAD-dependent oxidoreductase [Mesonia ostreae]
MKKPRVIIIGGGLAGLTAAIHLSKENFEVLLFEKDAYPKHKVCGEYISAEIIPYMNNLGIDLEDLKPKEIHQLLFSTQSGKKTRATLPLGGLGISRFALDHFLVQKAIQNGVEVIQEQVSSGEFIEQEFQVETQSGEKYLADLVLGAFGKRSILDKELNRDFIQQKSSWLAVKAHYQNDHFPKNLVALHNFKGGYCGLSATENGAINVCYLSTYQSFKAHKNSEDFKENILRQNPCLDLFFKESKALFEKDLSIAQISFQPKPQIENHMLMLGDAAGLIHPLCGNGMAMAIHSAKLASEAIITSVEKNKLNRKMMKTEYQNNWDLHFKSRNLMGRRLQRV